MCIRDRHFCLAQPPPSDQIDISFACRFTTENIDGVNFRLPFRYEKTPIRRDLIGVLAPPVGLEETSKTLGNSNQTEMAVTPAVTFAAKLNCTADEIDLLEAYRRLPESFKKQALQMLQDIYR